MRSFARHITSFIALIIMHVVLSTSCFREEGDDYSMESIVLESCTKVNYDLANDYRVNNVTRSGQGMAISGNKMYRLFDTGICQEISIADIQRPMPVSSYKLGSYGAENHCNCAKIDHTVDGESIIYISSVRSLNGLRGKCFVERIGYSSSSLIQTISLDSSELLKNYKGVDIICGDDGFLWIFGYDINGGTMIYVKARKPSLDEGSEVVLTDDDLIDWWYDGDYTYDKSVTQGGTVHKGRLYALFGTPNTNRHIAVYNISTHQKIGDVDLNKQVKEEPEDIDFHEDKMILAIFQGEGYYALTFKGV